MVACSHFQVLTVSGYPVAQESYQAKQGRTDRQQIANLHALDPLILAACEQKGARAGQPPTSLSGKGLSNCTIEWHSVSLIRLVGGNHATPRMHCGDLTHTVTLTQSSTDYTHWTSSLVVMHD